MGRKTILSAALAACALCFGAAGPAVLAVNREAARELWVADRDADAVVRLDGRLLERGRWTVAAPVAVRWGGGAPWVLSAVDRRPDGRYAVGRCRDAVGRCRDAVGRRVVGDGVVGDGVVGGGAVGGGAVEGGAVDGGGAASVVAAGVRFVDVRGFAGCARGVLVLARSADGARAGVPAPEASRMTLWLVEAVGGTPTPRALSVDPEASTLAASGRRIAVGTSTGRVLAGRLRDEGFGDDASTARVSWEALARFDGPVVALAPSAQGGWSARLAQPPRALELDRGLRTHFAAGLDERAGGRTVPAVGGGWWCADVDGRALGRVEVTGPGTRWMELPAEGLEPVVGWGRGVVAVAPGAVVAFDGEGVPVRSQGGFACAVDACAAPTDRVSAPDSRATSP